MKLRSSEIFDNFAKIALDKGLISEAAEGVIKTVLAESTNPRYDSKTLSDIEILYGVRPNGKDEKDIIGQAHPESVVIAPAYDRLNGLVENVKERHDIMVGIAMKPHQGKLTGHKYAKQDLLNELIRLGTFLDSKGQEDLMSLADGCTEKLTKEAATWKDVTQLGVGGAALTAAIYAATATTATVGWPIWAGIGLWFAGSAMINHFGEKIDQKTYGNAKRAISRLEDITGEWRIVNDSRANMAPEINAMINDLKELVNLSEKAQTKTDPNSTEVTKVINDYVKMASAIEKRIPSWKETLKSKLETELTHDSDIWSAIKGVGKVFSPDTIESAISALETLEKSIGVSKAIIEQKQKTEIDFASKNKDAIMQAVKDHKDGSEKTVDTSADKELNTFQKALDLLRSKPSQQQGKSSPSSSEVDKFIESINLGSK